MCAVRVETGRVGLWMDPDVLGLLGGEGREHTWLGDPGECCRGKGQDADEVAARNQSSTDAYRGLGLRTFILGGREEMTHRRVFKARAGL